MAELHRPVAGMLRTALLLVFTPEQEAAWRSDPAQASAIPGGNDPVALLDGEQGCLARELRRVLFQPTRIGGRIYLPPEARQ